MPVFIKSYFRIIGILCFLMFSFALIGCGDKDTPVPPPKSVMATPPPVSPVVNTPTPTAETKVKVDKPKTITSPQVTGQGPNGEGIKGHTDKQGVKIYHLPGDPYYSRTTHVSGWFFNEKDAQAAGYRHIK